MGWYQGRALETARGRRRRRVSLPVRFLRLATLAGVLALIACLPWRGLRQRFARLSNIQVEGTRYLEADRVAHAAGLATGQDLFSLDLERARQRLLLDPRVAAARIERRPLRGVKVSIVEREPVLLVDHGVPWEIDSTGILMPPLESGEVADVPLLVGPHLEGLPGGAQVDRSEVRRGLAWVRALSAQDLQLAGQVSEVDVSDAGHTGLTLLDGTRVLAGGWPPSGTRLSALRVVIADLHQRGTSASEVDLRFENQVIVRPLADAGGTHGG